MARELISPWRKVLSATFYALGAIGSATSLIVFGLPGLPGSVLAFVLGWYLAAKADPTRWPFTAERD